MSNKTYNIPTPKRDCELKIISFKEPNGERNTMSVLDASKLGYLTFTVDSRDFVDSITVLDEFVSRVRLPWLPM